MSGRDNTMRPANGPPKTILRRPARTTIMKYRANITAPRKFHVAAYRRPAGYQARRWAFGQRLPSAYFARDYWISNFWLYGLMQPWDGYEWVRVGDDALLVDVDTGEVIRVEYDVFY
jgi:Ni/Co efflux regulator RcnB